VSVQLSILFYIKKSKANLLGYTNIYLRITLDGKRAECSINRKVHINLWNSRSQKAATQLRDVYLGKDKTKKMLLETFQEHNDKVDSLIGKDFAAGTAERYRTCKKHVADFIKKKYKKNDIPVKDVDHKFITGLEYYLKTTRKCAHNSAIKYITNFKKIIRIAHANDWIDKDPFLHWKAKLKIVEREFLT